ncbi:MAG: hypothetical protein AMXMBFR22_03370 [Phycisphaerae bacterium]
MDEPPVERVDGPRLVPGGLKRRLNAEAVHRAKLLDFRACSRRATETRLYDVFGSSGTRRETTDRGAAALKIADPERYTAERSLSMTRSAAPNERLAGEYLFKR